MTSMTFLCIIIFLIGLYFYAKGSDPQYIEQLTNNVENPRCPNMLIQKGTKFYLYNSKVVKVPGVNPIEFDNLEDYTEFLDWQKSQGIRCPVLYLQQTYDVQGNPVYKSRTSISDPQNGLPSSQSLNNPNEIQKPLLPPNPTLLVDSTQSDRPYNINSYPSYDESSYYVGTTTPLDKMNEQQENMLYSPNPMDSNWGGTKYTQNLVDKGYYKGNEVSIAVAT